MGAAALFSACGRSHAGGEPAPQEITFSLGTNADFVATLLAHYRNAVPQVHVTTKPTYGAYLIATDIQEGRGHMGIAQADAVYLSYRRGSSLNPKPHTSLRGIAVLGINPVYAFTRRDSDIQSIHDLRGRRVGIMPAGTSSEVVVKIVLEQYGLDSKDIQTLVFRTPEGLASLDRGDLDVMMVAIPAESVSAVANPAAFRLLSLDRRVIDDLETRYPFLRPVEVDPPKALHPPGRYHTVGADAVLICTKDLDDDLVYQMTKELFVAIAAQAATSKFAADIDTALAATTPIPLHPGAARYYRERELLK
jgi:uncharacterized protein